MNKNQSNHEPKYDKHIIAYTISVHKIFKQLEGQKIIELLEPFFNFLRKARNETAAKLIKESIFSKLMGIEPFIEMGEDEVEGKSKFKNHTRKIWFATTPKKKKKKELELDQVNNWLQIDYHAISREFYKLASSK